MSGLSSYSDQKPTQEIAVTFCQKISEVISYF